MKDLLRAFFLNLRLLWNRVVFWSFPTSEESYYAQIGLIYFEKMNYRKAISCFLKSEKSHGRREVSLSRFNTYYLGHSYLNLGNLIKAIEYLENYSKLSKKDPQIPSLIGQCYFLVGDCGAALEWHERALAENPESPETRIEMSEILTRLGRKEEALSKLRETKSMIHGQFSLGILQSLKLRINGDLAHAIDVLEDLASQPDSEWNHTEFFHKIDAYMFLSEFWKESGNPEACLNSILSAYERNNNDLRIIFALADEYGEQGIQLDTALSLINRALECQPENPLFLNTKGLVLFKMGRKDEARPAFEKCFELHPNCEEAKKNYSLILEDDQRNN